jgi:hypothetical protein
MAPDFDRKDAQRLVAPVSINEPRRAAQIALSIPAEAPPVVELTDRERGSSDCWAVSEPTFSIACTSRTRTQAPAEVFRVVRMPGRRMRGS